MAITSIKIEDRHGNSLGELADDVIIKSSNDPVLSLSESNLLTLSCNSSEDIFGKALEQALEDATPFVSTINSVGPTADGHFFMHGSECASWEPAGNHGISLLDLCPSCTTCDNIEELNKGVERCRKLLDAFKDANLGYTTTMVTPVEDDGETFEVKGLNLLAQYISTVHMWNYVTSRSTASTEVHNTPSDPAGFYVQTKRAISSCGSESLKCTIKVSLESGQGADPLSLYIPDDIKTRGLSFGGYTDLGSVDVPGIPATVIADFGNPSRADTYSVTAQFFPFVYYEIKTKEGEVVTFREVIDLLLNPPDPDPEPDPEPDPDPIDPLDVKPTLDWKEFKEGFNFEAKAIDSPLEAQYNDSKVYPSESATARLRWKIEVTWDVGEDTFVETYYFKTNGVRTFMPGVIDGASVIVDEEEEGV